MPPQDEPLALHRRHESGWTGRGSDQQAPVLQAEATACSPRATSCGELWSGTGHRGHSAGRRSLVRPGQCILDWWSGTGWNCRPSAKEVYHPESNYLEKPPTAQLTRIDAADRLFSVSLTRITSVPECAVSSVGFLWGSTAVSRSCGVSVGLAEAPDWAGRPSTGTQVLPTSGS